MTGTLEDLSALPLLGELSGCLLRSLAPVVRERTYAPGQMITLQGDPCRDICFVAQGLVRQRYLSVKGRHYVLAYLGRGGCFGIVPALDGGTHVATVDALTKTLVYALPCPRFAELVRSDTEFALSVAKRLASEARRLNETVQELALNTVRARLAKFLLTHAEDRPPQRRWTQEMIAGQIGTVRDVVGRTIRLLMDEDLIRRERGRIVIVDRAGLQKAASDA